MANTTLRYQQEEKDWAISPRIYAVIFGENARVLNIYCQ
jgi:hypothetical protein